MASMTPTLVSPRAATAAFRDDVFAGLDSPVRTLPSKYFYDETGSRLFDEICELEEYYPTRVEAQIMARHAAAMADLIGRDTRLVEFGSGSSLKTRILLDHLIDPTAYVPIDISADHLLSAADRLSSEYPLLDVSPVIADFTGPLQLPEPPAGTSSQCLYFPGSTIGNFSPETAVELLRKMADLNQGKGQLLIGFDLQKEVAVLEAAYNDRQGVTAAFNKNILRRINRELDADFAVHQFEHLAFYNRAAQRIEMHLVSQCEQQATIAGEPFYFGWGETVRTEYSHKYTVDGFCQMARSGGWSRQQIWTDPDRYFAVGLFAC